MMRRNELLEPFIDSYYIRCPECGNREAASDHDGIFNEGEIEVSCEHCGHDYVVETSVAYTFESPAKREEAGK